ncbi:MAG: ABC transporter ATP-binding protein [Nitriliruptorales bacterium]
MGSDRVDPVLHFEDVSFVRDGRTILDRIRWGIRPGERWILLGPNGAGKSTLLRLASTYGLPTRGRVHVLGHRVGGTDLRVLRADIGYVSPGLGREVARGTRALDAVVMGVDATLRRWRQEYTAAQLVRARELLTTFGCDHVAEARFETLSEGERQRVQVARALMADPALLLLDEPTAGLDLGGREQLVSGLAALAANGQTPGIVFVTHHVEEVPPGFTHALLLRNGAITAAGPLEQTLTSETLSACFGVPVTLRRLGDRWAATAPDPTTV